jgi:hypothetical protein
MHWINIDDYFDVLSLSERGASEEKHDAMRTATKCDGFTKTGGRQTQIFKAFSLVRDAYEIS